MGYIVFEGSKAKVQQAEPAALFCHLRQGCFLCTEQHVCRDVKAWVSTRLPPHTSQCQPAGSDPVAQGSSGQGTSQALPRPELSHCLLR